VIYRIPTRQDYRPIVDEVTGAFRDDLKRLLGKPDGYTLAPPHGRLPRKRAQGSEGGAS